MFGLRFTCKISLCICKCFFHFFINLLNCCSFNLVLVTQWLFCHNLPPNLMVILSSAMDILAMYAPPFVPFPFPCPSSQISNPSARHVLTQKGSGSTAMYPYYSLAWISNNCCFSLLGQMLTLHTKLPIISL